MTDLIQLPPEPDGPVWDRDGERWDLSPSFLVWCGSGNLRRNWFDLLWRHGPLSLTPPWKPEVGDIVETREQYEAMPAGSVVEDPSGNVYWLTHEGPWLKTGSSNMSGCAELAGTPRTILRVGWSL